MNHKKHKSGLFLKIFLLILYFLLLFSDLLFRKMHLLIVQTAPLRIFFNRQYYTAVSGELFHCLLWTMLGALPFLGMLAAVKLFHDHAVSSVQDFLESRREKVSRLDDVYPATIDISFYQKCAGAVSAYKSLEKRKILLVIPVSVFQKIDDAVLLYEKMLAPPEKPAAKKKTDSKPKKQKIAPVPEYDFSNLIFLENYYPGNPVSAHCHEHAKPDQKALKEINQFLDRYLHDVNQAMADISRNHDKILKTCIGNYPLLTQNQQEWNIPPIQTHVTPEQAGEILPQVHHEMLKLDRQLSEIILERYQTRLSYYRIESLKNPKHRKALSALCQEMSQLLEEAEQKQADTGLLYPTLLFKNTMIPDIFRQLQAICRKADIYV